MVLHIKGGFILKYDISYEHLVEELAEAKAIWHFNNVKRNANEYELELSDEDFKRFHKLSTRDIDIKWIMHKMSAYKLSLTDALITYITYQN